MHPLRMLSVTLGFILLSGAVAAQDASLQNAPPANGGVALVMRSSTAQTGSSPITDVTLTGTVRRIVGSSDETGTVVLKALATGESRIDVSFPSGNRSAVRTNSANGPVGSWTGPDGVSHSIPAHSLMVSGTWFFPALILRDLTSSPDTKVTDLGQETRDGHTVEHLTTFSQQSTKLPAYTAKLLQHLTQLDVYLDPSTLLPVAVTYNIHPANDAGRDAPMEIRYSGYRTMGGIQLPFHIQQFLHGGLILDLEIESATFNSGLSTSSWNAQ